ncbi:MAG: hypothetical protein DRK00_02900 [Thermoprotei archaeon]|nr:MAG: hypothetical protein DRK00_02900 [Thermoprotei archaeon]
MRVLELDSAHRRLRLQLETPEDLYFTSLLIDPGDFVTAWTLRQVKIERATGVERGERVRVKLTLQVKKVEFQRFTDSLRVLGVIVEAPEWLHVKGTHHTIALRPGDELELEKAALLKHHYRILKIAATRVRPLGVVSVGEGELAVGLVRPQGVEVILTLALPRPSKEGSFKDQLRRELEERLENVMKSLEGREVNSVVVAAPQLALEVVREVVARMKPRLKISFMKVSEGGLAGIYELLRNERAQRMFEEVRLAPARGALMKLLELAGRDPGRVALGVDEVKRALELRAVRTLLLLDEVLLSDKRGEVLKVLEEASRIAEDVVVIPSALEESAFLSKSGGIAAILYFRLPPS